MQIFSNRSGLLKYAFAGVSALVIAVAGTGHAADLAVHEAPQTATAAAANAGPCSHQHVLSRANYHFIYQVRHVPALPHVQIKSFSNIMQTRYEPAASRYNITRHYCTAIAHMDNGTSYPVAYVISENQGFAGFGAMNVDFCVDGFDRWRVHDNACRSLR